MMTAGLAERAREDSKQYETRCCRYRPADRSHEGRCELYVLGLRLLGSVRRFLELSGEDFPEAG